MIFNCRQYHCCDLIGLTNVVNLYYILKKIFAIKTVLYKVLLHLGIISQIMVHVEMNVLILYIVVLV